MRRWAVKKDRMLAEGRVRLGGALMQKRGLDPATFTWTNTNTWVWPTITSWSTVATSTLQSTEVATSTTIITTTSTYDPLRSSLSDKH